MQQLLVRNIMLVSLLVFIAGCSSGQTGVTSFSGIDVDFIAGMPPPNNIKGPFSVGVMLRNYNRESVAVEMNLWDVGREEILSGEKDFVSESIVLPSALYDERNGFLIEPGIVQRVYGPYSYEDVQLGDRVQFFVRGTVDRFVSHSNAKFCVGSLQVNANFGMQCSQSENIAAVNEGADVVGVYAIQKTVTSQGGVEGVEGVEEKPPRIDLLIHLKNFGNAHVLGVDEFEMEHGYSRVMFTLHERNGMLKFVCKADKENSIDVPAYQDLPLPIRLINGEAVIYCASEADLRETYGEPQIYEIEMLMEYRFSVKDQTSLISVDG